MVDERSETEDRVAFNAGSKFLEKIGDLLVEACDYSIKGDIHWAFHTMRQITLLIDPRLNDIQKNKLKLYEKYFAQFKSRNSRYLIEIYRLYQSEIMKLLEEGGYLIPLKEDKTSLF